MFLRNRIAAPQGQPQTSNPSPQDGGGLRALNQTQQPAPSMPIQPTFTPSEGMPAVPFLTNPAYFPDGTPRNPFSEGQPILSERPEGMPKYAGGPNPAAPFYTDGPRNNPFGGMPMPSPTPSMPLGETDPNVLTNFFREMRTPSAAASYERWKSQQENPFGGSPTNPFLGMPMPSPTPGMPLGEINPNAPTNPFPGLPGTPMPRSEIGFMPPSRNPFDTSEQAYRYHIETAKYPPGGVPSYEQWKSGRENRPNPFFGGLGSLLNKKFGSRR